MGEGEFDTSSKTSKPTSVQEQPPSISPGTVYPDWASLQAYYNASGTTPIAPPAFFPSSMASGPQGHPYMWGPQLIPPYGTAPPAYVAMYQPGGLYPHPPILLGSHPYSAYAMPSTNGTAESSVAAASGVEADGKSNEGKQRNPLKRSRGSLGSLNMLTSKVNDGKQSGVFANGVAQSGDSGSEGSSEETEDNSPNGSQQKQGDEHGSEDDDVQNENVRGNRSSEVTQNLPAATVFNQTTPLMGIPQSGITGPTTTLNIGMDYWGGASVNPVSTLQSKLPATPSTGSMVPSRDSVPSDLWIKDERELKRERRKQSNRESARRSRLRKQAECEELTRRVGTLKEENDALRKELGQMRQKCERLAAENALLTERLKNNQVKETRVVDVESDHRPDCNTSIAENN